MDALMSMVEGNTEVTDVNNIDQAQFKALLAKCSVWDFYDISKEEYLNKQASEKERLLISYYNKMVQGMNLLFVVWNLVWCVCSTAWGLFWSPGTWNLVFCFIFIVFIIWNLIFIIWNLIFGVFIINY